MRAPDKRPGHSVADLAERTTVALELSQCHEPNKVDLALKATRFFIAVGPEAFARTGELGDYNDVAAIVDALVKRYVEGTSEKGSDIARVYLADAIRSKSEPLYSSILAEFRRGIRRALERMHNNDRAGAGRELWDLDRAVQSMAMHAHATAGLLPEAQRGEKTRTGGATGRKNRADRFARYWASIPATLEEVPHYPSRPRLAQAVRKRWQTVFPGAELPKVSTIHKHLPKRLPKVGI